MDRASDQLLSGSALARYQNAAVRRCDYGDLFAKGPHRDRFADHYVFLGNLLLKLVVGAFEVALPNRVFDGDEGPFNTERLLYKIEGAKLCGFDSSLDIPVSRYHH